MKDNSLIVMIDDDQDDHEIFKMALYDVAGTYDCLFFFNCESAIAHFAKTGVEAPSFVFVDLSLPRIGGQECLVELQKLHEFDHPCIIVYSTLIPDEWHEKLKAVGVDRFMEKSGSMQVLVEQLQQVLD